MQELGHKRLLVCAAQRSHLEWITQILQGNKGGSIGRERGKIEQTNLTETERTQLDKCKLCGRRTKDEDEFSVLQHTEG